MLGSLIAMAAFAAWAGPARGDGLPVGNIDVGPTGVTAPGDAARIVALSAGRRTLVARVQRNGGRVLRTLSLAGRLTVPAVALDGTAGGLSADGRTVVLIQPRSGFPRARTLLAVLDAHRLRVRRRITLDGDFSFDGLSPDGRRMYLVQYVDPADPTRYAVRAYDVRRGRLDPKLVVDATEPGEDMRGFPVTRAVSADGRWAYTLYDGSGKPFVHALDTARGQARCIDLPALEGRRDIFALRLALGSGTVSVTGPDGPRPLTAIDTASLRVVRPGVAPAPAHHAVASTPTGRAWWPFALLAAGVAAALALLLARPSLPTPWPRMRRSRRSEQS